MTEYYWRIKGEGWRCATCYKTINNKMLIQNHAIKCKRQFNGVEQK